MTAKWQHFPLASAWLCQDCLSVGNRFDACPACASAALLSLAKVLNRDTKQEGSTERERG